MYGYLTPFDKVPKQLCSGTEFRDKIAGGNGTKSIIEKHYKPYGIPQGAPISDLLANLYLLDFDIAISAKANLAGGRYYRYSDDIFIIIPGDENAAINMEADVRHLISQFGSKLEIKEEKSAIVAYSQCDEDQRCKVILGGATYNQGIEYLGPIPIMLQHIRHEQRSWRNFVRAASGRIVRSGDTVPVRCARRICAEMS